MPDYSFRRRFFNKKLFQIKRQNRIKAGFVFFNIYDASKKFFIFAYRFRNWFDSLGKSTGFCLEQ